MKKIGLPKIVSNHFSDIGFMDFTMLYKDYTKDSFSFLVNNTTLPSDNHKDLRRTYYKMTVSWNDKTIDSKMGRNKAQYNLDRQAANMLVLSLGNVDEYELLTGKDV